MRKLLWRNWPLAVKLSVTITATLIVVIVGVSLLYTRRLQDTLRSDLEKQAGLALDALSVTTVNPILTVDVATLQTYADSLGQQPLVLAARIDDNQGRVLADAHDPNAVLRQVQDPVGQQALSSDTVLLNWQSDRLVAAQVVTIGSQRAGAVTIELSTQVIDQQLAAARTESLLIIVIALLAGVTVATLFIRGITEPVRDLLQAAQRVAGGDLSGTIPARSGDELAVLATTFNTMTAQLRNILGSLEQRVADRTRALVLSAEVSRRLSGILDQQQLVAEIVQQIQAAFNYYHVHIYLYDDQHEYLVMAGGTGEAASAMLAQGHRLEEGRGLVGRAAGSNAPVLVPDVAQDPGWVSNVLLPDTKAELAVPIASGPRVLGVLDVQHHVVNGLQADDVQLIQSIANQAAVALQNTRSYAQAQQQAEREAVLNSIGQKIQAATNVESALQITVRELGRALGAPRTSVQLKLGSPNGGRPN